MTASRPAPQCISRWTRGGNGTRFEEAAEVTYRQPFAVRDPVERETEEREAMIYLLGSVGIWRWFFGTDPI